MIDPVYSGVGSRETPDHVCHRLTRFGQWAAQKKMVLRSGGAEQADTAFEAGALAGGATWGPNLGILPRRTKLGSHYGCRGGLLEVFRPTDPLTDGSRFAAAIAKAHHPRYTQLAPYIQLLMNRNVQIVLGADCSQPSDFLVCWTDRGLRGGGTGQALRVAETYSVPIFDVGLGDQVWKQLFEWLQEKGVA